tara:strand:+ start:383 stop:670 length:288 start_codon:yes stop_codon:yes gene_type:complete
MSNASNWLLCELGGTKYQDEKGWGKPMFLRNSVMAGQYFDAEDLVTLRNLIPDGVAVQVGIFGSEDYEWYDFDMTPEIENTLRVMGVEVNTLQGY